MHLGRSRARFPGRALTAVIIAGLLAGCGKAGEEQPRAGTAAAPAPATAPPAPTATAPPGPTAAAAPPASPAGTGGDPRRGEQIFGEVGCNGCHMVDAVGGMVGPELTGIGSRPSPAPERWPSTGEYVRASILDPDAYVVPGYSADMPPADSLGLRAEDVEDVWAYLMTLR